jgi:hypothetical protein
MTNEPVRIKIDPTSELGRAVAHAGVVAVVLESEGVAYRLVRDEAGSTSRPRDVERVLRSLRRSRGALAGVDTEELLRDLREQREQDSPGRPA